MDDSVRNRDLNSFTLTSSGRHVPAIGFNNIQDQQFVGNHHEVYSPTETISYIDLTPVIQPVVENCAYHVSGGSVFINEASQQPVPQQGGNSALNNEVNPQTAPYQGGNSLFNNEVNPQTAPQFINEVNLQPSASVRENAISTTPVQNEDTRKPTGGKTPRRRSEVKPKLYQYEEPLSDPEEEKKRKNAINAKKNRDKKKARRQELENQVKSLTAECDELQSSNTRLTNKSEALERHFKNVCQQFNVPVVILPE